MKCLTIVFPSLACFVSLVMCNFYMGMFQKNDLLVAQDRLYKEKIPYRIQFAKYGRVFKCPITYVRVVDRLGYGPAPKTKVIRGGLQKKYIVLRLSAYNRPISVNIYVGCQNKRKLTTPKKKPAEPKSQATPVKGKTTPIADGSKKGEGKDGNNTSGADKGDGKNKTDGGGKADDAIKDANGTAGDGGNYTDGAANATL